MNDKKITFTLRNATGMKLHIKNNMAATIGPLKGKWEDYKEIKLGPGKTEQTDFFVDESHQLMVYNCADATNVFLYQIKDTQVDDGDIIELHETEFNIEQ